MSTKLSQAAIALLVATILWLAVKLMATYTTELAVPVAYQEQPRMQRLKGELPRHIRVEVTGQGHKLILPTLLGVSDSLRLSVPKLLEREQLPTRQLAGRLRRLLPQDIDIRHYQPEALRVRLLAQDERRVPIASRVEVQPQAGHFINSPIRYTPDSARLLGPASSLKRLDFWPTQAVVVEGLRAGTHQRRIPLRESDSLSVLPDAVQMEFSTELYTEVTQELPVEVVNLPLDQHLRLLPQRVELSYLVPFDDYARLKSANFRLEVDVNDIRPGKEYLRPKVVEQPPEVRGLRLEPPALRYVLQLNDAS